jgi:hypothetical protein
MRAFLCALAAPAFALLALLFLAGLLRAAAP